ncbi:MAG: HAD family hydrolase [Candidatus Odinarchaeota archaeon]
MHSRREEPAGLACIDLDGTLTRNRSSWQFIFESLGIWETIGMKNLQQFLDGEINYAKFAEKDVAAWEGLEEHRYLDILKAIPLNAGIDELVTFFRKYGFKVYLISAGLYRFAEHICNRFGFDGFFGNEVEIVNGKLTGKMKHINVAWDGKASIVRNLRNQFAIPPSRVIALGDSSGDLKMFEESGIKVAVNSTDENVIKAATISVALQDFQDLIPLLEEELRKVMN